VNNTRIARIARMATGVAVTVAVTEAEATPAAAVQDTMASVTMRLLCQRLPLLI
jgi:hypothetical protein